MESWQGTCWWILFTAPSAVRFHLTEQPLRQRSPHRCPGNTAAAPGCWKEAPGNATLKEKAHCDIWCVITQLWKKANFYVWVKCTINNQQVLSAHSSPPTPRCWITTMFHCSSSRQRSEMQFNIIFSVNLVFLRINTFAGFPQYEINYTCSLQSDFI